MSWQSEIRRLFNTGGSRIKQLILINIAVFLVLALVAQIGKLYLTDTAKFVNDYLSVPADPGKLLLRPWSIITYAFLHSGIWHLFWNMVFLYIFGKILEEFTGKSKIVPIYIYGAIFGAILFVLAYNVFPLFAKQVSGAFMVGASAAVYAVVWSTALLLPKKEFQIPFIRRGIQIIWIALFFTVMDLLSLAGSNAGGSWAHLGGALFGILYITQYKKGRDLAVGFNAITDKLTGLFRPKRMKVVHSKPKKKRHSQKRDYLSKEQEVSKDRQDELNIILEKISKSGYDSLSKKEKAFLFKMSNDSDG